MNTRQTDILRELQFGAVSAQQLSDLTGVPTASVRRDIQALRRSGVLINDARDNDGLYRISQ